MSFTIERRHTIVTDFEVDANSVREAFSAVREGRAREITSDTNTELVIRDVPMDTWNDDGVSAVAEGHPLQGQS